jgi:hypothetical protein
MEPLAISTTTITTITTSSNISYKLRKLYKSDYNREVMMAGRCEF